MTTVTRSTLAFCLMGALTGAGGVLAQQPIRVPGAVAAPAGQLQARRVAAVTHGTWTQTTPANYTVTICDAGCTINGPAGTSIDIVSELWGAGGGGGKGDNALSAGGGGGGGAYSKRVTPITVPQGGVVLTWQVTVGAGGIGEMWAQNAAQAGGTSKINPVGALASGGAPGTSASTVGGVGGAGGATGLIKGQAGGPGANPETCNGGAGGAGGAGAGPATGNNGGKGGNGGYYHHVAFPTCTAHGQGYGRTPGSPGGNGRVTLTW